MIHQIIVIPKFLGAQMTRITKAEFLLCLHVLPLVILYVLHRFTAVLANASHTGMCPLDVMAQIVLQFETFVAVIAGKLRFEVAVRTKLMKSQSELPFEPLTTIGALEESVVLMRPLVLPKGHHGVITLLTLVASVRSLVNLLIVPLHQVLVVEILLAQWTDIS